LKSVMRRRVMLCAAVVAAVSTMVSSPTALAGTAPFARATQARASVVTAVPGWSSFQHDGQISGVDPAQASVTSVSAAWTSPTLDGKVVAQPLVVSGQVFVATENNSVYALNASTGAVIWHSNLGTAESYTLLPCGNIGPVVGISSTPVVDTVTGVIYVVALLTGLLLHHQLFALNTADGSTAWQRPIDAPGADPSVHNQQGALALSAGNVYVPFGGRFGECGNYTGRVVASAEDGNGALITYTVPVTGHGAGIGSGSGTWAAGPSIDPGNGDLLVATGPAYNYTIADGGQSVLRLTPALSEVDRFTLSNWQALDATDIELSSGPVLVGGNRVFEMSQSGTGYLLNSAALGGVGGEVFSHQFCGGSGGTGAVAVKGSAIYVPCGSGLVALTVAADGSSFTTAWSGPAGSAGTPIVTGGQVWSLYDGGNLYALDAATGTTDFHAPVAATTPNGGLASGAGHVFVPVNSTIVAYSLTSAMAVLPAVSNGAYGGYITAATIQNAGGAAANVHIAYFDQNGAPVGAGDANTSLPVNASWTVRQDNGHSFPSSGGDAAQAGSAIVYSDQPVAVFVNEFAPSNVGDATSYSGVQISGGVGATLYAPTIVNNAYGGYTTGIGLLNEGGSPTDVTITYRDGSGAVVNTQTVSALAAHAYHALYSGDSTLALAGGFAGTATITSSAGQPLGAVVNETGPGGQFSSYDAVASGSANLFAPVALNNAFGGYYTGMGIQNTTGSSGSVTINYYDASGTASTTSAPIAANGYLGVYQGTDIATTGAYTAAITSTVAIAAIVNEVAPSNTSAMQSTSYNSFSAGDARLNLPLVENAGSDPWNTGEGIMNTGTAGTTVTVNYYDAVTGAAVGAPQTQDLAAHAFWGLYQPTGGLPSGMRATAVVTTSSGGQVAAICNESSATTFMSYDGQ
jgi:outer membrane protein assembly factor BamB